MSFLDRLRTAQYTSPSGVVTTFKFNELSRSRSHKTAIKELPQQDKADVQDLRMASTHYPIEATIYGVDYDKAADAFWDALGEEGPGVLQHPRWGDQQVLPTSIEQKESFVDGMRCAVFSIDFVRIADSPAVRASANPAASVTNSTDAASALVVSRCADQYDPKDAFEEARSTSVISSVVGTFTAGTASLTAASPSLVAQVASKAEAVKDAIAGSITNVSSIFKDANDLMRIPSAADLPVLQKVKTFLLTSADMAKAIYNLPQSVSEAAVKSVAFFSAVIGLVEATLNGYVPNRADAIAAGDGVVSSYNGLVDAIDEMEAAVADYAAPVDVLIAIKQAAADATSALIAQSFALPTQRRMTLERSETLLTLSYSLFGDVDHITDIETWNTITGDEYWLIPAGRTVVWYE